MHAPPRVAHGIPGNRIAARRAALLIGVALLLPTGAASAASPNVWEASADAEYGNLACGGHIPGAPILAIVDFSRQGGQMSIRVRMDGSPADVNTDYVLSLWNAADCSQIGGDVGTVTTDGFGVADETFSNIKTKGAKTFFASLFNETLEIGNGTTTVP